MKKITLFLAALVLFAVNGKALSITDPFYMPEKAQLVGDLTAAFTNNDLRLYKSFGIEGYLQAGITDRLAIGLFLGWAKIRHFSSGMQDPALTIKYRFFDGLSDGFYFDLDAFISPEIFDSPWNNDGGAAKGATDFGASVKIGSTDMLNNFTLYAGTGFKHFGHTDFVKSGTAWNLFTGAKYYADEKNSAELAFHFTTYTGLNQDHIGVGFDLNYAYEFEPQKAALIPYFGAERHNHDITSYTHWGVKVRYLF